MNLKTDGVTNKDSNLSDMATLSGFRLTRFLESYEFYSNNIDFRIISSKAIEKFKNVQSFQLNQITNGKYHFEKDRKEILLLKYDMWGRWIYEIENLFIEILSFEESKGTNSPVIEPAHVAHIINLANKMHEKFINIITIEKSDYFDEKFVNIWSEVHCGIFELVKDQLSSLEGFRFHIAFPTIVTIINKLLQHTLFEIHELNGIVHFFNGDVKDRTPFLVYSELDSESMRINGSMSILDRLRVYMKHFGVRSIFIKNLSDDRVDENVFDSIEKMGVIIDYKLNY